MIFPDNLSEEERAEIHTALSKRKEKLEKLSKSVDDEEIPIDRIEERLALYRDREIPDGRGKTMTIAGLLAMFQAEPTLSVEARSRRDDEARAADGTQDLFGGGVETGGGKKGKKEQEKWKGGIEVPEPGSEPETRESRLLPGSTLAQEATDGAAVAFRNGDRTQFEAIMAKPDAERSEFEVLYAATFYGLELAAKGLDAAAPGDQPADATADGENGKIPGVAGSEPTNSPDSPGEANGSETPTSAGDTTNSTEPPVEDDGLTEEERAQIAENKRLGIGKHPAYSDDVVGQIPREETRITPPGETEKKEPPPFEPTI